MHRRQHAARTLRPAAPRPAPVNKLTAREQTTILEMLNSERFVDQAPEQIYAILLSEGTYLCSVATMYRLLRREKQVAERRRQARHPARKIPELVAHQPGEVFTWDITKLAGPAKGTYFDAYVMIDIYSPTSSAAKSMLGSPVTWRVSSSSRCSPPTRCRWWCTPIAAPR